jgi:type IV pilus biogenesis protein CpaD/CtpE
MKKQRRIELLTLGFLTLMMMTGCGRDYLYVPTMKTDQPITVKRADYQKAYKGVDLNDDILYGEAERYRSHGDGNIEILVTYDPSLGGGAADAATNKLVEISEFMRKNGVTQFTTHMMPVANSDPQVLFSYKSYTAHGPKDCKSMMDMYDDDPVQFREYDHGCATNSMIAAQVARPKDLLGSDRLSPGNALRSDGAIDRYTSGEEVTLDGVDIE